MTLNLRSGLTAAAVALLTLAPATAAHAAMTSPVQIDTGGSGWTPSAAVDGGSAIVGLQAQSAGVKVVTSAGNGAWNPAVTLSSPTAYSKGAAVTVDEDGNQTAIWGEYFLIPSGGWGMPSPGPTTIRAAHRTASGAWSAPEQLATPAGGLVAAVAGPDGRVTATWWDGSGFSYATRMPGGAWSASAPVAGVQSSAPLDLAVAEDGTITALWKDLTNDHALVSTLPVGGAWTAPTDVSNGTVWGPALDMNRDGDATVVWHDGANHILATRRATSDGAWTAPEQISVDGGTSFYAPNVSVDRTGRATAVWNVFFGGSSFKAFAAERAADGTWGAPVEHGAGESSTPAVGTSPTGEVYVAWYGLPTRTVTRAADGTWGPVVTVAAFVNSDPVIATDPDGDLVMVGAPNGSPVQVAGWDHAGPGLNQLSVPTTVKAGAAFGVSVTPRDLFSGLGTVTWNFGDGTTKTGTTASYAFGKPGTKTVTATATDASGRTRSRTRTVLVTAKDAVTDPTPSRRRRPPRRRPPSRAPRAAWSRSSGRSRRAARPAARRSPSAVRRPASSSTPPARRASTCARPRARSR